MLSITAGADSSTLLRHPPRLRIQSVVIFKSHQQSNARHHPPPRKTIEDEKQRVGGRVHAVVMPRSIRQMF